MNTFYEFLNYTDTPQVENTIDSIGMWTMISLFTIFVVMYFVEKHMNWYMERRNNGN